MTGRIFFTTVCSVSLQEVDTVCLAKVWGTAEQVLSGLVWEEGVVIFCLCECSSTCSMWCPEVLTMVLTILP